MSARTARSNRSHWWTRWSSTALPGPPTVAKCGADSTTPSRTMPGNPTDARSAAGSGATSLLTDATSLSGGSGYGVGTFTRSATMAPAASSTDAFRPVPPMSTARVNGCSGAVRPSAAAGAVGGFRRVGAVLGHGREPGRCRRWWSSPHAKPVGVGPATRAGGGRTGAAPRRSDRRRTGVTSTTMTEPWLEDACSLVDAFRAGTLSPTEALEASLAAIEASDSTPSATGRRRRGPGAAPPPPTSRCPSAASPSGSRSSNRSTGGPTPRRPWSSPTGWPRSTPPR